MEEKYTNIKERLLYFAKNQSIGIENFLENIGMTYGSFKGKAKEGSLNSNALVEIYTKYPELSIEWLLTGNGEMLKYYSNNNAIAEPVDSNRKTKDPIYDIQRVPLFNLEATMGLVPLVEGNGVDEEKVIDYITIPSMPSCDGAIYASGDSMYPLLKSGDMIAYKRIAVERASIFFGEMYIVAVKLDESSTMKTIKFVHQSELGEEYVKLVSHNQHHAPKDVKLSQIAAIGLVRASIRLHN
ncbi:transcriptional regulator [Flavobacterium palustre]|uniref:Transcriptional regulator n=1 Tax=Flavobacterium palustre TaxID=1476463 RepID=A0ABQ1HQ04_9FLAO|nr:S24 family peptidase [Flavobacterium palustre]GGA84417.1 transcriptional regulator [Flavobacterium palustre]